MTSSKFFGKIIVVAAPSGSGKSTVVRNLFGKFTELRFSISATSRTSRQGEVHGQDYYFISNEDFLSKIKAEEFLEWQEVYQDQFYGTLKSEINKIWNESKLPIFDVDVFGGVNLKNIFGKNCLSIFIKTPSIEILEQRLRDRGTEDENSIIKRLNKSFEELKQSSNYDYVVVNDNLQNTYTETESLILKFINGEI